MKKLLFLIILCCSFNLFSAPYNGEVMRFKQPDGSFVDIKLYGTEYYMRAEGLDGYTLIRDPETNWIHYAKLSVDRTQLVSTGITYKGIEDDKATFRNDLNLSKNIDITEEARNKIILTNKKLLHNNYNVRGLNRTEPHIVQGAIKGICILVDFSDEVATLPKSEFENFCNNLSYTNYGNNGSLRKYYSDISGGLVDYENVVYGYYRAPKTFAQYEAMAFAAGAQEILGLALNWVNSQGFDFSTLSINPDGSIMAINLMYTGVAQNWSQGMWYHQGTYTKFSADGVHSGSYNCSPANDPLKIATVVHENGHMIGKWPDTYKYDSNTGVDGIGGFDLMCSTGNSYNPVPPNPFFRSNAGWGKVVDVTFFNGTVKDTANSSTCYKFNNTNDTTEFFLLESRRKIGRSVSLPDSGLTIWHIDRKGDNQSTHHEVYLVHANNNISVHTHACFYASYKNEYGPTTTPNSNLYSGSASGLRAWDVSGVGPIMTYKLGTGIPSASLNISYQNLSGDLNANGFIESGESADINLNANNFGQVSSGNSTVTCTAKGSNASYVNVNTPSVNIGVLNVSQTVPFNHNITVASNTPIGTQIELEFYITDGTASATFTKIFIIGQQILIDNQSINFCAGMFYDKGGAFANYANSTDYTMTILPENTNQKVKVQFSAFDLEASTNCEYDYLKIYNGNSISTPLIGTYCGTTLPGTISSTHTSGALTFVFHADEGLSANGWTSIISCSTTGDINETETEQHPEIFPNPSINGIFTIKTKSIGNIEISICDILGKEVYTDIQPFEIKAIDLSNYENGLYFIKLKTDNKVVVEKIVLNK